MEARLGIAHRLDVANENGEGWLVPTRYSRIVADVLLEAVREPRTKRKLTSDAMYADLIRHVISRSEFSIPESRLEPEIRDIIPLLKDGDREVHVLNVSVTGGEG